MLLITTVRLALCIVISIAEIEKDEPVVHQYFLGLRKRVDQRVHVSGNRRLVSNLAFYVVIALPEVRGRRDNCIDRLTRECTQTSAYVGGNEAVGQALADVAFPNTDSITLSMRRRSYISVWVQGRLQ